MTTPLVFIVGFSPEQRDTLVHYLNDWGVKGVVMAEESGLVQFFWPALAGDRLEPRPSLLIVDGTRLSETGLDVVNALIPAVDVLVSYDTSAALGLELLLQSLRQRLARNETAPAPEPDSAPRRVPAPGSLPSPRPSSRADATADC